MEPVKEASKAAGRNGGLGTYHFIWIGAALVASGYLVAIAIQPELMSRLAASDSSNGSGVSIAKVNQIENSVAAVERDLVSVKRLAIGQQTATRSLSKRVTALEARFDRNDPKIAAGPVRDGGSPGRRDRLAGEAAGKAAKPVVVASNPQTKLSTVPKVLNDGASTRVNPISTGSIARVRVVPPIPSKLPNNVRRKSETARVIPSTLSRPIAAPAASVPVGKTFGVELGGGMTLDALRFRWLDVTTQNKATLGGLAPIYRLTDSASGDPLRLVAGPIVGQAHARQTCARLKARGVQCRVTSYTGDPL